MLVRVEVSRYGNLAEKEGYAKSLSHAIKNSLGISVLVSVGPEGSVARSEGKAVRVVDRRN